MSKKEFVVIFIFTLLVVIIWAFSDIVRTPASEAVNPNLQKALQPVNGSFDSSVIEKLNSTDYIQITISQDEPQAIAPVEETEVIVTPQSTPTATDSAEQTATDSANI